jgi:hypothetical protein
VKAEGNWEHGNNILFRAIPEEKFLSTNNLAAKDWNEKASCDKRQTPYWPNETSGLLRDWTTKSSPPGTASWWLD